MANFTPDDRFYRPEKLFKAFGILSILMMIATLWMILDDFGKEWKGYQKEFMALQQKKFDAQIKEAEGQIDPNKLKETQEELKKGDEEVEAKKADLKKLDKELDLAVTKEKITTANYQGEKAVWDVEKYQYESEYGHEVAEGEKNLPPKAQAAFAKLMKHWDKVLELRDIMNTSQAAREGKEKDIAALEADKLKAEKSLKVLRAKADQLTNSKKSSELTLSKLLRSAPLVDFANPTFRLQQVVLPTIRDDIYFAKVQKVDRCQSCHMAIDTPGFENEPNPFKTHPRLDLILGSRSPHPLEKIGCTVCHEGRGQATQFSRTAHMPHSEEQKKMWEKKYGYHEVEHIIERMIPLEYTEGKCRVCHKQTEYVPKAEKLNSSVQLIRAAGCYGCHRIEGWDHVRKPAWSLKKVKGKLTRDWIVKWVKNPQAFNEFARMPGIFFQSNITTDEFKQYQEAEVQAIADYLIDQSDNYAPNYRGGMGNAERGKDIFKAVGCLGCHQVDDFGRPMGRWTRAPDLSTVGSKVTKDWLATWLHNPRHYYEDTTMPSLRLNDSEISDLTAYLMSKKNPTFEQADVGKTDLETQKKVLKMYLMRDPKLAPATNEKIERVVADLSPHEVVHRLGEAAVMRYGCYGCHEMKGLEKTQGIGKDLSEEGSQPVNKFDFGLQHMEHSNIAWFEKKFEDSRIYDEGVVKEYLDLLRMPAFHFEAPDRAKLITAILGFTSQDIKPPAAKLMSARDTLTEEKDRIVHKYNCQGCHVVEGLHQKLADDDPNWGEHEKTKYDLEGRILHYFEEDPTLGPPPLVTEGRRVQTAWLHDFIENPARAKIRPKLQVRMPSFNMSTDELNRLITGWAEQGNVEFPYPADRVIATPQELSVGRDLLNKAQCLTCHTVGQKLQLAQMEGSKGLAPDFFHANQRLRREWIMDLLHDPNKMIPETRMPGFWAEGVSPFPDVLKGNTDAQIEAVADYVLSLGAGKTPPQY